jgi:hypothetical protein
VPVTSVLFGVKEINTSNVNDILSSGIWIWQQPVESDLVARVEHIQDDIWIRSWNNTEARCNKLGSRLSLDEFKAVVVCWGSKRKDGLLVD